MAVTHEYIRAHEYTIHFYHYTGSEMHDGTRSGTICEIRTTSGEVAVTGNAILNPGDRGKYSPALGRQIALGRALQIYDIDVQPLFWQQYYDHFGEDDYRQYVEFLKSIE